MVRLANGLEQDVVTVIEPWWATATVIGAPLVPTMVGNGSVGADPGGAAVCGQA